MAEGGENFARTTDTTVEGTAEMGLEATAEAAAAVGLEGEAVVIEEAGVVAEVMHGVVVVAPVAEEEGMGEGAAAAGVGGKSLTVLYPFLCSCFHQSVILSILLVPCFSFL